MKVQANTEYTQALDEYNKRDALNGFPEPYAHSAWNEAENFLPVFIDAVAKKFGMSVSLLLVGPLVAEEGNIAMQRWAMTQLMWPEYDNSGFTSMQESLIQYGEAVFSLEECRQCLGLNNEPNATDSMQLMDGPYQPSNEPDPDTFTLTDNWGIDAKQTFASGFFNMWAMQAHMPKTGFTGLMDGDWTQDMQFWNNAPNIFNPEVQARLPLFNTSPLTACHPTSTDWGGCHCHCHSPTYRYPIHLYNANSAALLWAFGATLSGNITMPLPLLSSIPSPGVTSTATAMSPSLPASGFPPSTLLPDLSLVQLTQSDKENLMPPEDAGYVAPSKGKQKSTVKPAAKLMATKRALKKK
ncbi:hypothetical protein BDN71DRAFT_1435136 [Pleurotus eryngii]|uniref:Uncharacterized protein n=1 Tax=Pleurotus eryngii TaxID=5323 RepID=A0A9P6D2C1_PLEER|nr:hypothetical protein BDN71DRAFT_1435136 [Pleurotus eryngii]